MDGSIVGYTYNPQLECLEKRNVKEKSTFDTTGLKVLTLNLKKLYFDEIVSGSKKIEYRELKQSTLNKYTYIDEANGKRYKLTAADGVKLDVNNNPEVNTFGIINYTDFTLTFEPFDTIPESFDFKAGDGEGAFVIRNISLK